MGDLVIGAVSSTPDSAPDGRALLPLLDDFTSFSGSFGILFESKSNSSCINRESLQTKMTTFGTGSTKRL
jgi:hypothetical protein